MSLQNVHVLHVHQKVTFMVNRYEVFADDNGKPGGQVGFAEQKRLKIKERITIYTDSSKSQVLFEFNARKAIDLGSGYDVTDANGQRIGLFRKDFAKSLLRSTWHLEQPGLPAVTGAERNKWLAGFHAAVAVDSVHRRRAVPHAVSLRLRRGERRSRVQRRQEDLDS